MHVICEFACFLSGESYKVMNLCQLSLKSYEKLVLDVLRCLVPEPRVGGHTLGAASGRDKREAFEKRGKGWSKLNIVEKSLGILSKSLFHFNFALVRTL